MMHTTLEEVLGVLEEAVKLRAKSEQIFAKSMGLDADQAVKRQKDKETEEQVYSSLQGSASSSLKHMGMANNAYDI